MIATAENLIAVETEHEVLEESNNYEDRLNILFPLIAYDWMKMHEFSRIVEDHKEYIEPGNIVTALRSLVKLAEELYISAKFIGEVSLMNLMEQITEKAKRDILFLPSLYFY